MTPEELRALAAALLNTTQRPPGLASVQQQAAQARAYHSLAPYPLYHFQQWKTEDRGPLPRCLPIARSIVLRGARWLFGKPLQINVPDNPKLEKFLRDAWTHNSMGSRLPAIAQKAGLEGGIVLKFAYDETNTARALSIQSLSLCSDVRLYYAPYDRTQLLMARVQFAYTDPQTKKQMWYREEWTADEEVHYYPVATDAIANGSLDPDTYEGWVRDDSKSKVNPFGVIPLVHIKNIESDDVWGNGDLWELGDDTTQGGLYRVLDRIHLTYHQMDTSNQFDSQVNPVFIDSDLDESDVDKPLQPGQPIELHSKEGSTHAANVLELGGKNGMRPAMMEYAKDLRKQVLEAASSVFVDQAEFSNKGNLTEAVLEQLYQPQIEITNEKHKSYGDDGLIPFLRLVAQAVQKVGGVLGVDAGKPESFDVQLAWADYFTLSEAEKTQKVTRMGQEVTAGFTTQERATKSVAHLNGVEDTDTLLDELKPTHDRMEADKQATSEQKQNPPAPAVPPPAAAK